MKKDYFLQVVADVVSFLYRFSYEVYIAISTLLATFITSYYKIDAAITCFAILTLLDTITRINANAVAKKLKFNPFKAYFWREIKSDGFREMSNKVFGQYGVYLCISFVLDQYVFTDLIINIYGEDLTLPVISLYLFSFIELWSIGENIDEAGGINLFKRVIHFLPEKVQKIVLPEDKEKEDV